MKHALIYAQKKIRILFVALIVLSTQAYGQEASIDVPTYHPVSPNAASLGNYGLYPVNKNLGKVAVNIPIYDLSFKSLSVPISISYNTSGIRLNDIASWVGLGWTLNAGGAIIRNTKGLPDLDFESTISDLSDPDFTSTNFAYMKEACKAWEDTEPDQYVINALGITGSFYLNQNHDLEVDFEDASIAIQIDPKDDDEIHAILPDGRLLIFGRGADNSDATELTDSNLEYNYTVLDFITTWYLTELISSNLMDTVSFSYKENGSGMKREYAKPESERAIVDGTTPLLGVNTNWELGYTERKYLDKISWSNGYVEFITSANREDLEDDYQLDAIKVYEVDDNGSDQLIDEYHFVYDYYLRSGGTYPSNYSYNTYFNTDQQKNSREKSLRLLEMYRGTTSGTKHKHQFSYNSTQLKRRCTTALDYWGYGNTNSGTLLPLTNVTYCTIDAYDNVIYNYQNVGNGTRTVNETQMKAGVLERIIYPNGGYTEFEFEANESNSSILVGGLRIKSISNYADAMATYPASKKTYVYQFPNLIQPVGNKGYERQYIYNTIGTHALVSSSPHFNNNLGGEPVIEYGQVTEYEYSEEEDEYNGKTISYYQNITNIEVLGGGTITFNQFKHDDHEIESQRVSDLLDVVLSSLIDKNYFETNSWKRGKLTKEETYKKSGSSYVLLKSVEHTYETSETDTIFNNYVYSPWEIPYTDWTVPDPYNLSGDYSSLQYCYYQGKTILGKKVLEQTVVKEYDENGLNPLTTTTDYFYDNDIHLQLTRTHTTDSRGERIISITRYPDDVDTTWTLTGGDMTIAEHFEIKRMQWGGTESQIGKPIQQEVYRDYDDDEVADANELLSVQRTMYDMWGTVGVQPESISAMKGAVSASNQLEDRVIFHGYDDDGNPDEVSRANDIKTSYIWGYRNQYPIVKAENVSESYLETATAAAINSLTGYSGGMSDLDELLWDMEGFSTSTQRSTWASFNSSLRSHSYLADAIVTTYTYYPNIGISSETDPNGNTTYYDYDSFNRLDKIRDKDNNQVQSTEYNYRPIELSVNPTSLEYTSDASNETSAVTATQSWTASDNQTWISVSPTSGTGDGTITITVTENTSGDSRDGTVTIADNSGLGLLSKTIDIYQADVPSITLSATTADLYGSSDYDDVTVTSNTSWTYYVDYWDDYAWLNITRTNTGTEYNATLTIASNRAPTSGSWEAQIVIQGGGLTRYINVTVYP